MPAVLGIDAAWTAHRPSGVALVTKDPAGWRVVAAAPSYRHFIALSHLNPLLPARPSGSLPEVAALLAAALSLCGRAVDLVAADIPLARSSIVGRRYSDDQVSRAYGSRKCSTYPPSAARPGPIGDALTAGFARAGYPLLTETIAPPGLIEVYPHPALVELTGASERLPYKASKVAAYWPAASRLERRARLYRQWSEIIAALEVEIARVTAALPQPGPGARGTELKACEDMLDAIVCAWVGVCALEARAAPYGDRESAIWIPGSLTKMADANRA